MAMAKSIEALVADIRLLGEEQFQIVQAVRTLTKKSVQHLSEEVKYGGILFASGPHFGGVFAYKEHVSVEFGRGAAINDLDGFLEGSGKDRRHIKLKSVSDISAKNLAKYLPLALEAAKNAA